MPYQEKNKRIAARLTESQKERLDLYCKQNSLSIGEVIRNLVENLKVDSGEVTSLSSDIPAIPIKELFR